MNLHATQGPAESETPASVELFKAFIESPPVIEEIVFKRHVEIQRPEHGPRYHFARWQRNAALISVCKSLTNAFEYGWDKEGLPRASGRHRNDYWTLYGRQNTITRWTDLGESTETRNPVTIPHDNDLSNLRQILNMGMPHIQIGTVQWNGNHFSTTNRDGLLRQGTLFADDSGRASKLIYQFQFFRKPASPPTDITWEIEYFYDRSVGFPYLPNRLEAYSIDPDGSRSLAKIMEIYHLKTSSEPLPAEAFEVTGGSFAEFEIKRTLYVKGGERVGPGYDGRLVPLKRGVTPPSSDRPVPRGYLYLGLSAVGVVLLLLLWLAARIGKSGPH